MPKPKVSSASEKIAANIHDEFFRDVFEVPENIIMLIRARCPQALFDIVEWSTLRLEPARIAVDRLTARTADLVYSAKLCGGGSARVVLLFEHKSFQSRELEKQLARNQFLWYLQDDFQSLVIPIVVRQNAADPRTSIRFRDLFSSVSPPHLEVLMAYALDFRCVLIDIHELDRAGGAAATGIDIAVRAMAVVRDFERSEWPDLIGRIWHVDHGRRRRMLQLVIDYICKYNKDIEPQDVLNVKTATEEDREMVISAVDAFREEGRVEGLERGLERGRMEGLEKVALNLLQAGMESDRVAALTELSREQIEVLQGKMNGASGRQDG